MKRRKTQTGKGAKRGRNAAWRFVLGSRRTWLSVGLFTVAISLVVAPGCGTQPAKPYRGTLLKTIAVQKALADRWATEKKFNPGANCVQLVARDKTEDGVRKVEKLVLFSPDPCPASNQVADRESFVLPFVEASVFAEGQLPKLAYHVVKADHVVGHLNLTARGSAPEVPAGASHEVLRAASFEADSYELADLCTVEKHYRQNCEIEFTVDGKFSQVSTARAAVGRMEREKALIDTMLGRIDQAEGSLRGALNEVQTNLFENLRGTAQALQAKILANQNFAAMVTLSYMRHRLALLETNVTRNQTTSIATLRADLGAQIDQMQRDVMAKIETEVRTSTTQLREQLGALDLSMGIRMSSLQRTIVSDLTKRLDALEGSLRAGQWEATWAILGQLGNDLRALESRVLDGQQAEATRVVSQLNQLLQKYSAEVTEALRQEMQRSASRLAISLALMEGRIEESARRELHSQLATLEQSLKASQLDAVRSLIGPIGEQLKRFEGSVGARLERQERSDVARFRELVTRYEGEVSRRLRDELHRATSIARVALFGNQQRLGARLEEDHRKLLDTTLGRLEAFETALATSHVETSWTLLNQLVADLEALQGPLFIRLDVSTRLAVLDLARSLREYAGQIANQLHGEILAAAKRLQARLSNGSTGGNPVGTALRSQTAALVAASEADDAVALLRSYRVVGFLAGEALAVANERMDARVRGELTTVRDLVEAYELAVLRSTDGAGPLGGTLLGLMATNETSLGKLRELIGRAQGQPNGIRRGASGIRAEIRRILETEKAGLSATVRRDLILADQGLYRVELGYHPFGRNLHAAGVLRDVLGGTPIRASRAMEARRAELRRLHGLVVQHVGQGRFAEAEATLQELAALATSESFMTEVAEPWLATSAEKTRLFDAIDELR